MIEVMIAVVILTIVFGGAMSSQVVATDLVQASRETSTASTDLQACMERMLLEPTESLPLAASEFAHGRPIQIFEGLHLEQQRVVATYPGYVVGGPVPDPLPIVLTMTWLDFKGRPRNMELRSMRVR